MCVSVLQGIQAGTNRMCVSVLQGIQVGTNLCACRYYREYRLELLYVRVGTTGNTGWNSVGKYYKKKVALNAITWTIYLNYMGLRTTKNSRWTYVDFCSTGFFIKEWQDVEGQ